MGDLKHRISEATKVAMKARDKARVGALRLVGSEIKRVEVDERRELDDASVLAVLDKMLKQRRDSLSQFAAAGRQDLVDQERFEMEVIQDFLPEPLSEADIDPLIRAAIEATGAAGMRDMGKVMAHLRPQVQGRADVGAVSARVKAILSA
jgi:uncharacterized protein YqeY